MKKYIQIFLSVTGIISAFLSSTFAQGVFSQNDQKKPRNIIVVIVDDVGAEQIRSYANELQHSSKFFPANLPNIHLLEKAGIRFTQAWSNPSCSPTRAGIHTGQYSCTHGIYAPTDIANHDSLEPYVKAPPYVPLALSMAGSGYKRALFGKWHLGYGINTTASDNDYNLPRQDGFDHYAGSYGGSLESYMLWEKTTNGSTPVTVKTHATFDLINDAKNWISARSIGQNPFFAILAFNAPHWTGTGGIHEWNYLDLSPHCIDVKKFGPTSSDTTIYKAQLHCMDVALGELISFMKIKHPDVLDNTIIIFVGDNGTDENVGEGPVTSDKAKSTLYQGGIHVPFIIADGHWLTDERYRKTNAASSVGFISIPGLTCDRLIHTRDIYGTVRELAGIPNPDLGTESHSLVKFMTNPSAPGEQYVISEGQDTCEYAIRNDHYKLIHFSNGDNEFYKIDRYKWDDAASRVLIIPALMTIDESSAFKKLKAKLESMPCYCEKKESGK